MQRIEFSEMTNRLHRNAMGAAALIISIKLFNLQIDKAGTLGIEIKNFTTGVPVLILFIAMVYHGLAFAIRAFEEYRVWELELTTSLSHPALGQDFTPSPTTRRAQAQLSVRVRSARRGARVDKSRPCVA